MREASTTTFQRGLQSLARFGQKAVAVFDAIAARMAKLQQLAELFARVREFGVAAFTEIAKAVSFAALGVNQLAILLSNITRIPLGVVSAALALIAASILAAVVPTYMWAAAWTAVTVGFGILKSAAIAGLPVMVGWLNTAAASAWALAAPIAAAAAPFVAIGAAIAAAYVVMTRWQDFPAWLKVILLAVSPLVLVIRGVATALELCSKLLSVVMAVGRAAFGAIRLAASVALLPITAARVALGAIASVLGSIPAVASAAGSALASGLRAGVAAAQEIGAALWNFGERYIRPAVDGFARMSDAAAARLMSISDRIASMAATVQGWADTLTGLASRVTAPLTSAGNLAGTAGARVAALAAAAGIAAGTMSEFAYAADRAGVSAESVADSIGSAGGLGNFIAYAEQIRSISDPMEQAAEAQRRFGANAGAALEIVRRGPAWLAAARTEAARLGLTMDDATAGAANTLTQAYATLKSATQGLWQTLGRAIVPALTEAARATTDVIKATTAWVAKNQPLIAQVFRIASIVASVGTGLGVLATVLGSVAAGFAAASGVVAAVGASLAFVGGAVAFLLTPAAVLAASVAALASAFGVLAPLAAAVGVTLATAPALWARFGASATAAYQAVRSAVVNVLAYVQRVTDGVRAAIAGGDLEGAVRLAWIGVQKAWVDGLNWLSTTTGDVVGGILQAFAAGDWQSAARQAWLAVQVVFTQGLGALDGLWVGLQDTIGNVVVFVRQSLNQALQEIAKFAVSALQELLNFVGIVAAYDPTGRLSNLQVQSAVAVGRSSLLATARTSPDAANSALSQAEQDRQASRAADLATRQAARQAQIIGLRGQLIGEQVGAQNAARGAAGDLETRLADAIKAAETARDKARATEAEQNKALEDGAAMARKKAAETTGGGAIGSTFGATFSAASLMALGNGRPRVEKAVEATAGNTKKLVEIESKRLKQDRAMQLEFVA